MALRTPREKELKRIKNALRFFNSLSFLDEFEILIREGERKEVIALTKELWEFINQNKLECIVGIKIGEVGKRLRLTIEGAYWIVKTDRRKVWVNERGEMLFLYGRDIFASSVIKAEGFRENEIVFVCNSDGDVIGIGKSRFDCERIKDVESDRVVVENLVDRGEYIRKERLYDAF